MKALHIRGSNSSLLARFEDSSFSALAIDIFHCSTQSQPNKTKVFCYQSPKPTSKTIKAAVKSAESHTVSEGSSVCDENDSEAPVRRFPKGAGMIEVISNLRDFSKKRSPCTHTSQPIKTFFFWN